MPIKSIPILSFLYEIKCYELACFQRVALKRVHACLIMSIFFNKKYKLQKTEYFYRSTRLKTIV